MTDFNYGQYDSETLTNAVARCEKDIKEKKQLIKDFSKILNRPKGYSNKKLDALESRIEGAYSVIKILEQEIAECQAELATR